MTASAAIGAIESGLALLLHAALLLAAAPLLAGLVARLRARFAGCAGPPAIQPWRDLLRLARKQPVLTEGASRLTEAAPPAIFAASLAAAVLVPGFATGTAGGGASDLLVIAGLLGLARAVLALAALDAGTAFGAIGASRTVAFAAFAEPALLLVAFAIGLLAQTTNLDAIAALLHESGPGLRVPLALALLGVLAVALTGAGRLPADDPDAVSELAMAQRSAALDYSGRHLAMLAWADALRLLLWLDLLGAVFLPFSLVPAASPLLWPVGIVLWAVRTLLLATALAALEATFAQLRLFRVPELLGAAVLLGLLAALLLCVAQGVA